MKSRSLSATLVVVSSFDLVVLASSAWATTAFITFDDLPLGPSTFGAPTQQIVYPQATFDGGVILGNPTSFPQQSFATSPNVYGTIGSTNSPSLTITINPAFTTTEVSFPLFNGNTIPVSYTVAAFDASNALIASQHFTDIPSNAASNGFAIVDLVALGIVKVTITPDGSPSFWDFLIDSIALNQSVQTAAGAVPLPGALPLFATGVGVLGLLGWRRKRKATAA